MLYVAPLCPAGHLPRKGGDQPSPRPAPPSGALKFGEDLSEGQSPPLRGRCPAGQRGREGTPFPFEPEDFREPFRLSQRRVACRGRGAAGDCRGCRHAFLLLFHRHADPSLQGFCRGVRVARRHGLLRHEGKFEPGCSAHAGEAWRRGRRRLGRRTAPRAGGRHSRRARSCSLVSARRRGKWISRSTPASIASTSSPNRNWNFFPRVRSAQGKTAPVSLRINPGRRRQDA